MQAQPRDRDFWPVLLLVLAALALSVPAARADPHAHGKRAAQGIPPGQLPPPGQCRVWFDGEPPGQQPAPIDCLNAETVAALTGGRVIYGERQQEDQDEAKPPMADEEKPRDHHRQADGFDRLDRNDDGSISPGEWTGDARIFKHLDRNDDGRLLRNELQGRSFDPDGLFRDMDVNRDGRVNRREWWGDSRGFERLDRNDDGWVSRQELLNRAD